MQIDMTPRLGRRVYGGEGYGGAYYEWCPNDMPILRALNFGASKLVLQQFGLAYPRYYDSPRIGYVVQGEGTVGVILPEKEEKVFQMKKGDVIALPHGVVTWWYNKEDLDFSIFFIGDTSKGHKPGILTEYILTGPNGMVTGFSTEFVSRAFDLDEDTAKTLVESQKQKGIGKLTEEQKMPQPREADREGMVFSCEDNLVETMDTGKYVMVDASKLPLAAEAGLSLDVTKVYREGSYAPTFSCDGAYRISYVFRGSGRFQVVGPDGKLAFENTYRAGTVFVLPRFYVISKIANVCGMDWFSILTNPNPSYSRLAGKSSILRDISPETLQVSFSVLPHFEQKMRSKRRNDDIFFQ